MGVSIRGHSDPHLHSPCPQCGYATRYKQFGPIRCACPGQSLWDKRLAEIHAIEPTRYVRGSDGKLTCAIHKKEHDDT